MVEYLRPIDSHVHLRWMEKKDHLHFLKLGFKHARAVGLCAVLEQGNTEPPMTDEKIINERIALVDKYRKRIYHGIHIPFTPNSTQQLEAMDLVMTLDNRIVSDKIFYVRSTGSGKIEIIDTEQQRQSWTRKVANGYKGVTFQHLEDGNRFTGDFDPTSPITHSLRQNPESELVQVERQLGFAYDAGFEGIFYIARNGH